MEFMPGDRVQYEGRSLLYEEMRGETGTVLSEDHFGQIAVRWDQYNEIRHDCGNSCEIGHGWYVLPADLIPLNENEDNIKNVRLEEVL